MAELSHIEGLKELDALLKALPEEIARHDADRAVLAGAKVIAEAMAERCPVGAEEHVYRARRKGQVTGDTAVRPPGYARTQIKARMVPKSNLSEASGLLGDGRISSVAMAGATSRAFYLKFVEFGWNHTFGRKGAANRKVGSHIPARPFLRPSFESHKDAAMQAMLTTLWNGIQASAAKLTKDYYHSGFSKSGTLTRLLGLR